MYQQAILRIEPTYRQNFPVIDKEFDNFQTSNDLAANLHHAETSTFCHHLSGLRTY